MKHSYLEEKQKLAECKDIFWVSSYSKIQWLIWIGDAPWKSMKITSDCFQCNFLHMSSKTDDHRTTQHKTIENL